MGRDSVYNLFWKVIIDSYRIRKDWHPVEENNRRTHKRLDGIADPARVFSIFLSKIMAAISLILMAAEGWGEKEICTKGAVVGQK